MVEKEEKTLEQQIAEMQETLKGFDERISWIAENVSNSLDNLHAANEKVVDTAIKRLSKAIDAKLNEAKETVASEAKAALDLYTQETSEKLKQISEPLPQGATDITIIAGAWMTGREVTPTPELIAYFKEQGQTFTPRVEQTTREYKSQLPASYITTVTAGGEMVDYVRIQDASNAWFLAPVELLA